MFAINTLSLLKKARFPNEAEENNVSYIIREYAKQNKQLRYQINLVRETNNFAQLIRLIIETKFECSHYIDRSYVRSYVDEISGKKFEIRVFKPKQVRDELLYIYDPNKCVMAAGRIADSKIFILFSGSSVAKKNSELSRALLSKGLIFETEYSYKALSDIELNSKKIAYQFITGNFAGELHWGDVCEYDPAISVVMLDRISRSFSRLSESVVNLYEIVKALCIQRSYKLRISINQFENNSNFIASHTLDPERQVVEIIINENTINDVVVSSVLLYAKLKLDGIPRITVSNPSEKAFTYFAGAIETFLMNIIIRKIQDEALGIDRKKTVEEYKNSIHSNSINPNENIEYKYAAIFCILEYFNMTRNYEQYFHEIEKYKEIFHVARSIYESIDENQINDAMYFSKTVEHLLDTFQGMLKKDGVAGIDLKSNVKFTYPIS